MIKFDNVSVVRSGAVFALDSVSFEVETKSRCAVLGANGAGKSTLLWSAMGLLPLAGGAIYFDGTAVKKGNLAAVRKIAALVFQNSDDQLFFPSVLEEFGSPPPADAVRRRKKEGGDMFGVGCRVGISVARRTDGVARPAGQA